jgi:L-aspartate oxidase
VGKAFPDNVLDAGDVLIVGAGLAGLFAALKLAPRNVTVLANQPIGGGASAWAQGGIAAALGHGDTIESHIADTIAAGAGLVDEKIARLIATEASDRILDLVELAVPFDRDLEGKLKLGREGAHSHDRIVRVKGDRAGAAVMAALRDKVRATPSINIIEGVTAHALAIADGRVCGVFAPNWLEADKPPLFIRAGHVVLATGGAGALYAVTTNPPEALGEGVAMAARAGAVIADPEFIQFHPTAIDVGRDPAPLASEALRGEGAFLVNDEGTRFMTDAHALGDLAPRDIVTREVHRQRAMGHKTFLDAREAIGAAFPNQFPTVFGACEAAGIDPRAELIPIAPAAHYFMGGIAIDEFGRSSIDGLWACGEVTASGAHGANRLASNSLLESVVFAARVAADINGKATPRASKLIVPAPRLGHADALINSKIAQRLRWIMATHVGVIRSASSLLSAARELETLQDEALATPGTASAFANMFTLARLIVAGAMAREESRGGHYREDFPEPVKAFRKRTFLKLSEIGDETELKVPEPVHA